MAVGPDTFPVGARVCNTGTDPATNVTSSFFWDEMPSPSYVELRPGSLSSYTGSDAVSSLAPGACHDFYYEVVVDRDAAAYEWTRQYHITASADGPISVSTPVGRQIYVEYLISQSRNSTNDVKLDGVSIPPGGTMVLYVGSTYDIQLLADTATNGYEQIETYINLINTVFKVNSVTTTYSAEDTTSPDPDAGTKLYADGCSWENDPNSPNYQSCLDTGKYGGSVTVNYNVTIIGGGGTTQTLNTLIHDFSGSSFHYNSDYGIGARIAAIVDPSLVTIDKSFAPDPTNEGGASTLTFTLTNPNDVPITGANFTDTFPSISTGAPGDMVVATPPTYSTNNCGTPTFAPLAGAGSISFSDGTIPASGTCTVSLQVTAPTAGTYDNTSSNLFIDTIDTGDSASDSLTVDTSPPPPAPVCDLVMAQWTVPSTATDPPDSSGVPTNLASDVSTALASAGPGISANTEISSSVGQNDSYSWRSNGGFETGTFDPANNDYFQFRLDTSAYEQVNLTFWAWRTQNGPPDLHIYYDTDGSTPASFKTSYTGAAGLPSSRTWKSFTVDFTGDTSTTGDTYFYVFGGNPTQSNPGADLHLDLITVTGCQDPEYPTIAKSFSPDSIAVNDVSTLTFTLANPNGFPLTLVQFDDDLPVGLQVASTPNASTSGCGTPTWSPGAGDTSLSFSGGTIDGDSICTVQVDVTAATAGPHTNVSGFISSDETGTNSGPDGSATDTLTALAPPSIEKAFSPNPILVNGVSTLTFTLTNPNPNDSLTGVAFDDDLPLGVEVAGTPNASTTCGGSPTWTPSAGDTSLAFGNPTGASIPAGDSCTVQVDLTSASQGSYSNTSDPVTSANGGTGNTASDTLTVEPVRPAISLLKQVSTDSGGPWTTFVAVLEGADVYYQFTMENTGDVDLSPVDLTDPDVDTTSCSWPATLPAPDASDDDHIATCVVGPITAVAGLNENTATATGTYSGTDVSDTSTASYGTAELTLDKTVAETYFLAAGDELNYSYEVTNGGSAPLEGPVTIDDDRASDESCPAVTTVGDFDNFFDPGETITCTASYTVTAGDEAAGSVTNTATATVGGVDSNEDSETVPLAEPSILVVKEVSIDGGSSWVDADSPPGPNLVEGTDPQFRFTVTNDSAYSLSNVDLSDSDISSFFESDLSTPCTIPAALAASESFICYAELTWVAGQHSDTAIASGDFGGSTFSDTDGAHYFGVYPPSISKNFAPDPIAVGETSTLTFTLTNANTGTALTGVVFSDNLPAGLEVAATPSASTTCGGPPTWAPGAGATTLNFSGGTIPADSSCTAQVDVTATSSGTKENTSGAVSSTNGGTGNTASDTLTLTALQPPTVTKAFAPDTIASGGTTVLTITITNPNTGTGLTGVAFSDSYPAGVENASPLSTSNTCGGTLTASAGGTSVSLTGGSIAADDSCQVTVEVTSSTPGPVTNTTSSVSSNEAPDSETASDDLTVTADAPTVTKAFSPDTVEAGGTSQLTITLGNTNSVAATLTTALVDTLPANVEVANPADVNGTCPGTVTATPGGSTITYANGASIPAGGCTIEVDVTSSTPGTHTNTIAAGDLETDLGDSPSPASDDLTVVGPPSLSKNFSPDPITVGGTSTLTFTLTNPSTGTALTGVSFSDSLPSGVEVASTPNASTTCGDPPTWAPSAGDTTLNFSGGTVPADSSCTAEVDVTATSSGVKDNTSGTITSSNGGDGNTASDTLEVSGLRVIDPAVTKSGDPLTAQIGDPVTFTLRVFNNGDADAVGVVVTDTLPAFLDILSATVDPSEPAVTIDNAANTVTVDIGTVDPDDVFLIAINTVVNSLGEPPGGRNTVTLASESDDADLENNTDSLDITIVIPSAVSAPDTGFAPRRVTAVPEGAPEVQYEALGAITIRIPALGVESDIVGVPLLDKEWDVTWLWNQVGYLEGTAFPGWNGNSVLTSHVYLPNGLPGPFAELGHLQWGDHVIVDIYGSRYLYEVRESGLYSPTHDAIFRHEELSWLTLVTCAGYDETRDSYRWRRVVRAVLIEAMAAE